MNLEPRNYRILAGGLFVVGAAMLFVLTGAAAGLVTPLESGSSLVIWMTLISIGAMSPIPLGRGSATFSFTAALDFAAILLFGPALACWVAVLSRLVLVTSEGWNPILPAVALLGRSILAVGCAGLAFPALGGRTGTEVDLSQGQILPILGAAAVYLLLKHGLEFWESKLRTTSPSAGSFLEALRAPLLGDLLMLLFGLLLAWTQVLVGPVGMALFLVPLLLARYFFKHWVETRKSLVGILRTMMAAIDGSDPLTWGHSERISKMCLAVGRRLRLTARQMEELEVAALMHDIGRTAIQREILFKAGKLTRQEQGVLQTHPAIGRDIVDGLRLFGGAGEIVHAHHEQPDGNGYPRGLCDQQIPVGARILMAVAAFDAMTSDRPYRRGLAPEAAFEELLSRAGTQFYPDVAEALIQLYSSGELFSEFMEEQLEPYRDGRGNSRAIAEYLQRWAESAPGPEKRCAKFDEPEAAGDPDVLVLELPGMEAPLARSLQVAMDARSRWVLEVVGRSDIGCVRKNNEDSFEMVEVPGRGHGCLLMVADGMGGAAAGEVASRITVETVANIYGSQRSGKSPRQALERAVQGANAEVYTRAQSGPGLQGMGTTCTAVAVVGRELYLAHVGDSRAYIARPGSLVQISTDHTLAAELLAMSGGSEPAHGHNVLTRSLGALPEVEVDTLSKPIKLDESCTVVMCSDGLSNLLDPGELLEVLEEEPLEEAAETLVELARQRGGPDNITLILARMQRS